MKKMFKSNIAGMFLVTFTSLPITVFAARDASRGISNLISKLGSWVNALIPIVFTIALLAFFWGLATYLFKSGDDKDKGLKRMGMGIAVLFVMASLYGIIAMLQRTFDISGNNHSFQAPTVKVMHTRTR